MSRRQTHDQERAQVERLGKRAALAGSPFSANPHPRGTWKHTAWSQGHTNATAILERQKQQLNPPEPPSR